MDFLSSLVARTIPAAPGMRPALIQPRIASPFEPGRWAEIQETSIAPEQTGREEAAMPTAPGAPETRVQAERPQPFETRYVQAGEQAEREPVSKASQPPGEAPRQVAMPQPRVATDLPAAAISRQQRVEREAAELVREIAAPQPVFPRPAEAAREMAAGEMPRDVPARAEFAPEFRFADSHGHAAPSALFVSRRQGSIRLNAQAALARPAEPPSIQVTIGRVEVRATTPPAAASRRQTPAGMTIDDYLRKRSGGGSR